MIEANELRCGNLLYDILKEEIIEVLTIAALAGLSVEEKTGQFQGDIESIGFDEAYGIPITEEWLVKYGFDKSVTDGVDRKCLWYNLPSFRIKNYTGTYLIQYHIEAMTPGDFHYIHVELKYVHQLQNAYFALTGKDLILKEK